MPSGTCHAKSPVDGFTAMRRPHGGFWQGQGRPSWRMSKLPRPAGRSGAALSNVTVDPSPACSIQPSAPPSCVTTYTSLVCGLYAVPPQFAPPRPPGKLSAVFGGAPLARYAHGVNGPALYTPFVSRRSLQDAAWAAVVSAAVTRSSRVKLTRASGAGLTGNGCAGNVRSPGTSLFATGRSSTPNTGSPVSRLRMYM